MPSFNVSLPDNTCIELQHRELFWFARGLIDWHSAGGKHEPDKALGRRHYNEAVWKAEKELERLGIEFTPIRQSRLGNLIARGFRELYATELTFLDHALQKIWIPSVPLSDIHKIEKTAKEHASRVRPRVPEETGTTTAVWARVLDLPVESDSQKDLSDLVGHYFIFRRVFSEPILIVSHMEVTAAQSSRHPAEFVTTGFSAGAAYDEADRVEGIMYQPIERRDIIVTIGKMIRTTQMRMAILQRTLKPIEEKRDLPRDLMGIRLGLGRPPEPQAYRIWCSRLSGDAPTGGWKKFAREYELEIVKGRPPRLIKSSPRNFFMKRVHGFKYILEWLNNPVYATLRHRGDPTI
jgi:hypothetical protein